MKLTETIRFITLLVLVILLNNEVLCQNSSVSYIQGEFFIDSAQAQNQYYTITQRANSQTIQERGIFLSNPDIIAKASFTLTNGVYDSIEINFDNGTIKSTIKVIYDGTGVYHSYKNNELIDSVTKKESILFFDGPNPSFDITNASLCTSKKTKANVVLINWVTGTLSTKKQIIKKKNDFVWIEKPKTKRKAQFNTTSSGIGVEKYTQNKESYTFKTLDIKTQLHE